MKKILTFDEIHYLHSAGFKVEVQTPSGFEQISSLFKKFGPGKHITLSSGASFIGADNHRILIGADWVALIDLQVGDSFLDAVGEQIMISEIEDVPPQDWYDFEVDAPHSSYIQSNIVHHNSGKSLIAYCLYRWYLAHGKETFMLVVPNLSLVKQMYNDFREYSLINKFDVEHTTQIVAEGATKKISKNLILATWQSVYKQPTPWLNQIDVIFADEAHQYKADAIKGIFEKATDVKYRFGVTGSLDKSAVSKMVLRGMIGEISKVKTTRDLINEGYLADVKIECMLLKYSKETAKALNKAKYQTEIDFICRHEKRNKLIRKLALGLKGVTLVLFNFVEKHGEVLYEEIKNAATTQDVHLVSGKVDADVREEIRQFVQSSDNDHIIVASVGTMSTGTNIPRINNIIFASPTKSVIRVMQSLGRGLRLSDDKAYLTLFDIADSIYGGVKPNHTMLHFKERLRIYVEEQHPYRITEMNIE